MTNVGRLRVDATTWHVTDRTLSKQLVGTMDIAYLLTQRACAVVRASALSWTSGTSSVVSVPAVHVSYLFGARDIMSCGTSLVRISGATVEPLHYHKSHVVGIVVRGRGWLLCSQERRERISTGDCIVIPRGVLHFFVCDAEESMEYVALEVSDQDIDYQKHFYGEPE